MYGFCLEVAGRLACFTRPEMKAERLSYELITPSAARAIFEAILWKPAIRWRIKQIDALNPVVWFSVRRNEVDHVVVESNHKGIFIEDRRQQRAGLLLRDVCYRLHAEFDFIQPKLRPSSRNPIADDLRDREVDLLPDKSFRIDEKPEKYAAMFDRRAKKGSTFTQPYLGCREFPCSFRLVDPNESLPVSEYWRGERDLGWMLYDINYADPEKPTPLFFRAKAHDGTVKVPPPDSKEVRG
jgi:CRISPR-associated protein Cas5d